MNGFWLWHTLQGRAAKSDKLISQISTDENICSLVEDLFGIYTFTIHLEELQSLDLQYLVGPI